MASHGDDKEKCWSEAASGAPVQIEEAHGALLLEGLIGSGRLVG
jgi:hypothetical protein